MRVSSRMTREPITINPVEDCRRALFLMRKAGVTHLPVLDGARLVGIVTEGDIRRRAPDLAVTEYPGVSEELLVPHVNVGGVMTYAPITVGPGGSLAEAAELMLTRGISCLPVIEEGRLVGILTRSDVISGLLEAIHSEPPRPAVLLVEDDPDTQALIRVALRNHYDVLVAASGEEARKELEAHGEEVRIILMDLSLKGDEDGLALTRYLRQQQTWRSVPIIATTAHALPEDQINCLAAGCNAYLAKPFYPKDLLSVMEGYVSAVH